ncbi:hypothetical protein EBZ38_14170 [bacterium]|nr:hypothetical protein [bacterium]NDD85404.1 hypothetical protein [bacterium]
MDYQKMLVSVGKVAVGWMLGMWAYKSFMSGGGMTSTPTTPTTPLDAPTESSFGYDGDDM